MEGLNPLAVLALSIIALSIVVAVLLNNLRLWWIIIRIDDDPLIHKYTGIAVWRRVLMDDMTGMMGPTRDEFNRTRSRLIILLFCLFVLVTLWWKILALFS